VSAPLGPTDAELVARVLTADREAFATVYDRYGTKLYDFAYSMLRHREDAADAVADSFVLFAERLPQLREPDRLRPWLYAITRSECLRRLKARKRVSYGDDEQLIAMPDDAITPEESAERAALQKIVWDAAAGLADRDRALLDLHLRQGLEGAELGEAMGVSASNAYVMLNRLRGQVDRSLGALLIARMGRDDCDDLDDLLSDWDGTFSPLIRKRVARHVENCEICSERRKKIVSPWMLLAGVPVFVAPIGLRDRVVNDTQLVAFHGPGDTSGIVASTRTGGGRKRAGLAAAAVLIAGSVVTTAVVWPDGDTGPIGAAPSATATLGSPSTKPTATATTPSAPASASASASASAEPSPTDPALTPGALAIAATAINLGSTATIARVGVTNTGGEALAFQVTSVPSWLSVSPASGELDGGESSTLTFRADRAELTEGATSGNVVIAWAGRTTTVKVSIVQENDPVVGRPFTGANPSCSFPVRAAVSDESRLTEVVLSWNGPHAGTATMVRSGGTWIARAETFSTGGDVTFRVTATDSRGNTTTGPSRTVYVLPCPG